MERSVKTIRHRFGGMLLALVGLVLLGACGPVHIDPRWSSISTISGDQILLAFGDRLSLVNATDGKAVPLVDAQGNIRLDPEGNPRVWDVRHEGNGQTRFYNSPVLLDEDTLLAPSYDRRLLTIDLPVARVDGPQRELEQNLVSSPVIGDGLIYQGLADHDLVALDASNMQEVWRIPTGHGVWADPLLVEDTLYFTSMDHFLYAVNAQSGELLWKSDLQGALTSTPVYNDGHLYVGGFAKKVFDVSAETGEILAEYPTAEWVWSAPTLVDGVLYVSDLAGKVYALETSNGLTEKWQTAAATRAIPPSPLVAEDVVVVGSRDQKVYWLNRETGEVIDSKDVAGEVLANLLLIEPGEDSNVSEPLVIVSTSAPQELLVAFTLERGQRVWAYGR